MLDAELSTGILEGMGPDGLSASEGFGDQGHGRSPRSWRGEVDAVVGQHRMDLVGNGLDQTPEEVACGALLGLARALRLS